MNLHTRTDSDPSVEVVTKEFIMYGVIVPVGFEFDGCSTPRILWSVIPPMKRTKVAACLHDYLCKHAKTPEERKYADGIFKKCLEDTAKINKFRIGVGYLGVRLGAFFGAGVRYPHWSDKLTCMN